MGAAHRGERATLLDDPGQEAGRDQPADEVACDLIGLAEEDGEGAIGVDGIGIEGAFVAPSPETGGEAGDLGEEDEAGNDLEHGAGRDLRAAAGTTEEEGRETKDKAGADGGTEGPGGGEERVILDSPERLVIDGEVGGGDAHHVLVVQETIEEDLCPNAEDDEVGDGPRFVEEGGAGEF